MRNAARMIAAGAITLAGAAAAQAGDYADREILGFSPNGRYFAFEEYGVLDGSGFPYSNIYVIDTVADAWTPGSPVRVRLEDDNLDNVPLDKARAEARKKAAPLLKARQIGTRGFLVASNPATEFSADPHFVRFSASPWFVNGGPSNWTLTMTLLPFPESQPCENLGPVNGFRLVLADLNTSRTWTLQDDAGIPATRGCPLDYAISDVVTFLPSGNTPTIVVLISIITQGFEGPDRRFMAATTEFEGQ